MDKVKATCIKLHRAEGRREECITVELLNLDGKVWERANKTLIAWSRTVQAGYDKCDFTVTYADGETYTGRYDLEPPEKGPADLAAHMRSFLIWYGGRETNPYCGMEKYKAFLAQQSQEDIDACRAFLDSYEIGGN